MVFEHKINVLENHCILTKKPILRKSKINYFDNRSKNFASWRLEHLLPNVNGLTFFFVPFVKIRCDLCGEIS